MSQWKFSAMEILNFTKTIETFLHRLQQILLSTIINFHLFFQSLKFLLPRIHTRETFSTESKRSLVKIVEIYLFINL